MSFMSCCFLLLLFYVYFFLFFEDHMDPNTQERCVAAVQGKPQGNQAGRVASEPTPPPARAPAGGDNK